MLVAGNNQNESKAQHIVRAHVPLAEIAPATPQPLADAEARPVERAS